MHNRAIGLKNSVHQYPGKTSFNPLSSPIKDLNKVLGPALLKI